MPPKLAVALDERERPLPGVVGGCLVLLLLAVEERVRCALICDDLVHDAGRGQGLVEGGVLLAGDVLVRTGLQGENRPLQLRRSVERAGPVAAGGQAAVEADGAGEIVAAGGGEPRVTAAEAEADRVDRFGAVVAEPADGGGDVELDRRR